MRINEINKKISELETTLCSITATTMAVCLHK